MSINNPDFVMSKVITHKFNFHILSISRVSFIGMNTISASVPHGAYCTRDMVMSNIDPLFDKSLT